MEIQILESGKIQILKWSPQRWKLTWTFKEPNNKWPHSTHIHSTPLRGTRSNPFAKFSNNRNVKSKTSKLTPHQEEVHLKRIPILLGHPKLQIPRAPNDPKQRYKDVKQPPKQKFQTRKKQQTKMDDTCAARSICGFDLRGSRAGSGQACRKDKNPRRTSQSADKLPKNSFPRHLSPENNYPISRCSRQMAIWCYLQRLDLKVCFEPRGSERMRIVD